MGPLHCFRLARRGPAVHLGPSGPFGSAVKAEPGAFGHTTRDGSSTRKHPPQASIGPLVSCKRHDHAAITRRTDPRIPVWVFSLGLSNTLQKAVLKRSSTHYPHHSHLGCHQKCLNIASRWPVLSVQETKQQSANRQVPAPQRRRVGHQRVG